MRITQLFFLPFFFFLSISALFSQDFTIDAFETSLELKEDGKLLVKESIAVDFSEKARGIIRSVPYQFTIDGKKYTTKVTEVSVDGHPSQVSKRKGNVLIKIGDKDIYLDGRQNYLITYTVDRAFVEYDGWQELYWNVTGNGWDTPIEHAAFSITLPSGIELEQEDMRTYTGRDKAVETNARIIQSSDTHLEGSNTSPLKAKEGLTIAVRFPQNYLKGIPKLGPNPRTLERQKNNKPFHGFIPAALLALIFSFWQSKRKRTFPAKVVEEAYYPPKGLTSAHVGAYVDHRTNDRDIVSLIPYWATEGFIKVIHTEETTHLEKLEDLPGGFPKYEIEFFDAIFKEGNRVSVSSFVDKFYSTFAKIKSDLSSEIKQQDYYDDGYNALFKSWRWFVFCLAFILFGIFAILFGQYLFLGIGCIIGGFISLMFSIFKTPFSEYGYSVHQQILGLKQFLENPNQDTIKDLLKEDPKYFENMLPYAVAFGIDDSWIKSFEPYFEYAPAWYYMETANSRPVFSNFSESFTPREISSAFSSYPSTPNSSSSSPSSGGGFSGGSSGGGFGGGGGSSW